jgi:DNA-binding MarR family transcriptional regulator
LGQITIAISLTGSAREIAKTRLDRGQRHLLREQIFAVDRVTKNPYLARDAAEVGKLVVETFRLNGQLLAAGDRLVKPLKLTSALWQVLGALRESETPLTVSQIARAMGLQRQSVQRNVDILKDQGLVKLVNNPNHRRAKLVMATADGRKATAAALRRQVEWAKSVIETVGMPEIQLATQTLAKLRQCLNDDHE